MYGWLLVFVLGLKHGLAADHIAAIDGLGMHLTRQGKSGIVPWLGTFFALGHGIVITLIISITGMSAMHFHLTKHWIHWLSWLPILLLFVIAFLNVKLLIGNHSGHRHTFALPNKKNSASNSLSALLIGACFAMFLDTLADAASWGYSAATSGSYAAALCTGAVFTLGMLVTDTIDSRLLAKVIRKAGLNENVRKQRRLLTWIVVVFSFAIGMQELISQFFPGFKISDTEDMIIGGLLVLAVAKVYIGIYISISEKKSIL
ncbi:hypothetical protein A9P82_03100 [Arachidicoccus ginsenosidimutans]|uniref:hypothetical protein n=1 Tax=Arachidicoccus sp. BS20 TaxID=1850526 RepID=UPI0007F087AC|nr:hypothetical protein [Arachidicoccus sp. BS20]ANI88375.1 hypothetical protein A9P82_03100 [Arachidicoccus sp. BS20]